MAFNGKGERETSFLRLFILLHMSTIRGMTVPVHKEGLLQHVEGQPTVVVEKPVVNKSVTDSMVCEVTYRKKKKRLTSTSSSLLMLLLVLCGPSQWETVS